MAAAGKTKKGVSVYLLPALFCALLIVLGVMNRQPTDQPVKAVLREGEPLTLNELALENYLYSAGFTLAGEAVLDSDGKAAAALTWQTGENDAIEAMTLTFSLPTYYETENAGEALASLKAAHDAGAQRGEDLFLALFDAIAATDSRVQARRDSALTKLRTAMDTGASATQAANTWRFSFSLSPGLIEGQVAIRFEKVN